MKRLAAILLLAGCAYVPEPVDPVAEVWDFYADEVNDAEVSVALVKDGIPTFAGDPRTIYRIGPLTDFFVLEAARRLEERGEIDLDRPVTAFNTFALDPLYGRVSLRELAELRKPLVGSSADLGFIAKRFPWVSDGRLALFAALLEHAVGKPLEEILRDEIVIPLMLRDTSFTLSVEKLPRVATRGEALGGLYSTVEDCVKFFASAERVRSPFLLTERLLHGARFEYAAGRAFGCRRYVIFPEEGRDFLLIFRNITQWSLCKDFEFASKVFAK